jgi:ribonuclease R
MKKVESPAKKSAKKPVNKLENKLENKGSNQPVNPKADPFADREAAKYENPIASREMILETLTEIGEPQSREELAELYGLHSPQDIEALRRRLRAMERDGQLMSDRKGSYALIDKLDCVSGKVSARRDGSGWVTAPNGTEVYLDSREMQQVFPGDEVCVRVFGYQKRKKTLEGKISEVLVRHTQQVVGRFCDDCGGVSYVKPENQYIHQDIIISSANKKMANPAHGDFVVVQILSQPSAHTQAIGQIIEILGTEHTSSSMIEMAIRAHHLPYEWPQEVLEEAELLPDELEVTPELLKGRQDWRALSFVTIDGEDAKDFDDAVYCEKISADHGGGWMLYVAIADVSYYVRLGTALDAEAQIRGNSVYFTDRVIPMLPEKISNGLCSLKPEVDRLTLGCKMKISAKGQVEHYEFSPTVIHSKARLTYTKVADILENPDSPWISTYANLLGPIRELHQVFLALFKTREERGALDFDTVETRMVLGADGRIEKIIPVRRNIAHRIIEECMLAANVAAAEFLLAHKAEGVFRIHEPPRREKIEDLRGLLKLRGLFLQGGESPSPKDFSNLLKLIQGRPDYSMIQTVILRTMSQAVYSQDNIGHYGLAYEAYTHFTSPIRRYPDLLVHRVIRLILDNGDEAAVKYLQSTLSELASNLSHTERRADEASRDVEGALKCAFMEQHIGEEFDGVITGVTNFGLFVMVDNLYVDGLVHVTSLKQDYYHFDEVQHALIGERTSRVYKLGDRLRVKVVQVSISDRKIDFELVG